MKVHIVTEGEWIKKFWSDKVVEYNKTPIEYSISYDQRNDVDINFYICYNTFLGKSKSKVLDIGYVTHIHDNNPIEHSKDIGGIDFFTFKQLDGYIHQSQRSMKQFEDIGFNPNKSYNVTSPIELHKFRLTITLGIIQNGAVAGKGLYFLMDMLDKYDFTNFKFIFCGKGWEQVINKMNDKNIRNELYTYSKEEYYKVKQSELYEKLDYLFVPSLWEGGPVAPLEAMASGVKIVSSDVGFMPEFGIEFMFPAGNVQLACNCMHRIEDEHLLRRNKVMFMSYDIFNEKLFDIFNKLIKDSA